MRLYQSGALLTGARNEVIRRGVRHRGRSAPDGPVAHTMGADFVKVMSTGGFMTKGAPPWSAQFSPAELEALVAEAHRLGKRAAAHDAYISGLEEPAPGAEPAVAGPAAAASALVMPAGPSPR
jgi:imidazolonepropionase-like amidohydrolase